MGIGFLLLCTLCVYEIINIFFRPPKKTAGIVIVTVTAIAILYSMVNARMIHINTIEIPADVDMNIVQLSDIHFGSVGDEFLQKVVEKTNTIDADIILITGDLLDPRSNITTDKLTVLNQLNAPVFFVTGNHERYAGVSKVMRLLEDTKIRPLRNEAVNFGEIQIIGIDDSSNKNQVADMLKYLNIDPDKFSVLMYHRPEGLESAADAGIELMLTGHAHNGQIFPFNYIVRIFFSRINGLFKYKESFLYVSSGTGTWGPPMRLGSKNQITLFKLHRLNNFICLSQRSQVRIPGGCGFIETADRAFLRRLF